ncbi:MAG TPA: glycerol-3-phosphate dehydrogenase C-terminal domain-containing protein, partial [Kineosporiaceae bacterium]|nr:glycerol-3-phosphate dehydrogenase C-terminal domain-containing protein [Kineosporiaceae bacterium]
GRPVRTSKGVHLLLRALPGDDPVLARTRDGRHVVVSPWQGSSLVGPTDDEVPGPVDDVQVTPDDVAAVLATLNSASVERRGPGDVEAVTVGVRPLAATDGGSSYRASRRAEWVDHRTVGVRGLWTVTGGKWTTARATAEGLVHALTTGPDAPLRRATPPRRVPLDPYGPWPASTPGGATALPPAAVDHLRRLYGAEAVALLARAEAEPDLARPLSDRPRRADLAVQVVHGVEAEGARTLDDLVDRRLVLGTLGPPTRAELERVARCAAPLLGWAEQDVANAVEERVIRDRNLLAASRVERV